MKIALRLLATIVCLSSIPAFAQSGQAVQPSPHPNDDCLMCHGDPSADRPVAAATFAASVHGQAAIGCVDCHTDVATVELPHAEKLAPVNCAQCHDDVGAKYDQSIHAEARRQGMMVAAACKDCHGTHDILPSSNPESRTYHLNLPRTCGRCHGNEELIRRAGIKVGNVFREFQDSIHGQALAKGGLMVAPNCSDCHGAHDIERLTSPASRIYRANVPATCGKCHEGVENRYLDGIHGTLLRKTGDPRSQFVPVCNTCHTAHRIQRVETGSWRLQVLQECGGCHTESIKTYRDTFHGQVTALGFVRTATCADCHSAHEVFPKSDARSSVAPANLVRTCGRCHSGATPQFVRYDPHADRYNRQRNPSLYYAGRFMSSLLIFVFAFFGVHTTLWFARSVRGRRTGHDGGPGHAAHGGARRAGDGGKAENKDGE